MHNNHAPAKWRGGFEDILGYEQFSWKKRLIAMAQYISEEDKSVMDLGAGRMHLRKLLKEQVAYYPVDYKKNAEDTIVCDFNKHEFPDKKVDVIFAAGILGYIEDPKWFLDKIISSCRKCIISYMGREKFPNSALYTQDIIEYMREKGFSITGRDYSLADDWTLIACFERIGAEDLYKQIGCTGCGACVNACNRGALELKCDESGFYKPHINTEKCVNCGACVSVCPLLRPDVKSDYQPEIYAAWAKDSYREVSSSGGVFSVLAETILRQGGYVFGAAWDDDFSCKHLGINQIEDVEKLRHSKYVQSNTQKTFSQVKELIKDGVPVLYVGCPCQIKGLKSYLGDLAECDKLCLVDLVCFGVPSVQVFQKYLEENYGIDNVENVIFRDKGNGKGWSPTGYSITLKDGTKIYPDTDKDGYQNAFHKVLFRNDVCDQCEFYRFPREGDITLGDFWGIDMHDVSWDDRKGTSVISVNSAKGARIIEEVRTGFERLEQVPVTWCSNKGNRIGTNARASHKNKEYFTDLVKGKTVEEAVNIALADTFDIGLVCMMNYNIGNNLTNYALYQVLKDMGKSVVLIDMPLSAPIGRGIQDRTKYFLRSPYSVYELPKRSRDKIELSNYNEKCGLFLVGSDQLWRDIFVRETGEFACLEWAASYKYKMSYGTSLATDSFVGTDLEQARWGYLLSRFQRLSVREAKSKEYLKMNYDIDSYHVLDPVFLCDKSYFNQMADRGRLRQLDKDYVGAYLLDVSSEKQELVIDFSNRISNGAYMAMSEPTRIDFEDCDIRFVVEPAVEEWLSMMRDSKFVVTDSFHGMCFALIFEKQFAVVYNPENWRGYERFRSLLTKLGLESRMVSEYNEDTVNKMLENMIDYTQVNTILQKEIFDNKEWLKDAIAEGEKYKGKISAHDLFWEMNVRTIKNEEKATENNRKIRSELYFSKREHRSVDIDKLVGRGGKNMNVVGWGAGACFRSNIKEIRELGYIKYVCDNNEALWGAELCKGITCISPEQLSQMDNIMVLIMVENAAATVEVINQLLDMGIANFDHVKNWLTYIGD